LPSGNGSRPIEQFRVEYLSRNRAAEKHTDPETFMKHIPALRYACSGALAALAAAIVAGCSSSVPLATPAKAPTPAPTPAEAQVTPAPQASGSRASNATNPRAYRADAASHLYGLNQERIYKGRMPPLLYAIGVLQVEVDGHGNVRKLDWMRAPKHAPEVVAEIERTVRAAAPFPAPARMGKVVYTDTWLWHKSGRFQLDTLTEGQD
jgi:periplasmic protein TonB